MRQSPHGVDLQHSESPHIEHLLPAHQNLHSILLPTIASSSQHCLTARDYTLPWLQVRNDDTRIVKQRNDYVITEYGSPSHSKMVCTLPPKRQNDLIMSCQCNRRPMTDATGSTTTAAKPADVPRTWPMPLHCCCFCALLLLLLLLLPGHQGTVCHCHCC